MNLTQIIAPSVLNANFLELGKNLQAIEQGGAELIHLDIMDGHFVPNISFGPTIAQNIKKGTSLPLDCHLMISNPENYVEAFAKAGAHYICIHAETTNHLDRLLHRIEELGCIPAVSINPATPIESIRHSLDIVQMVLIMSVNPGFGGQKLIPYTLDKIKNLRDQKPELNIQIDGGIKLDNIQEAQNAGANIFVVGSAIFESPDPQATCQKFVEKIKNPSSID
ncbi:MAG: ribulose-phosphate 3-epimerase [Fibrobacter sp.]|jgi:ribulose-phosphate 3-epimerase|nr:ribulose-phosphate 3-epimerase [Fibrobacter sp.]